MSLPKPLWSPEEFYSKLQNLKPGQKVIYHQGWLTEDRRGGKRIPAVINAVADIALQFSQKNRVALVQKRLREGCYLYVAIGLSGNRP